MAVVEHKQMNKKKIGIIIGCVVAALALIAGIVLIGTYNRVYHGYRVVAQAELYRNLVGYEPGNGVLLQYSNDGAKAILPDGTADWELSYHLDNPAVAYSGEVASVADIGGKTVYIVAENGIPYNYEVLYPIVKHDVANQGVTAVLLDNGTEDFIRLYDIEGNLRVDINTKTKHDGIPVDIALSSDGKRLVTLYLTFDGSAITSKVTFYNAGEVGKNHVGNIVGQKTFEENLLVYDVDFLDEDYVYILHENGFVVYYMQETPKLVCDQVISGEVLDMAVTSKGIYCMEENEAGQKQFCYYEIQKSIFSNDISAKRKVWSFVPEYEELVATEEEVVFFSPQSVSVYRTNGSLIYEGTLMHSYEAMFPLGEKQYFLVDTQKIESIKLTKEKQEGE